MVLLTHIIIALLSLGVATLTYFMPTIKRLAVSYGLIVATAASGTALLLVQPGAILHTCLSGLLYVTVISIITIATHVRTRTVAHESLRNK